jgi:putative transposase
MQLVEQHIIRSNEWGEWCVKAKELYNQTLYYWRQSIFKNIEYFTEYEILGLFREFDEPTFKALPSHCGQEVLINLFKNIKSWQKAIKEYKKNPSKFLGRPKLPNYKKKMSILGFNNGQIKLKKGFIHFPKMIGIKPMKTKIPNGTKLGGCRVIPKNDHFVVEFVYEVKEKELREFNGNAIGIDLGLNNLATIVSTTGYSTIINGKPLKSMNQWYNKQTAYLKSKLPLINGKQQTSKRINKLTFNRNNKIKNYAHHSSKYIVKQAIENNVTKIIIGNNKNWKQEVSLGKKNNQNFVSIPYKKLIEQIEYKSKLNGIKVEVVEESYTSKCSALDLEPLKKHEKYVGKRVKRGLFRTAKNQYINADANGSLNIIRKSISEFEINDRIVRCVVQPKKILHFKRNVL